ncbi:hypothetical protein OCC_02902 [Thermococcus litoralis DSM 5473]|uniref:Uncharacterized protein n=1 Tax=Thermococcus litoralis (strain ATCC 51850 / DSM 5473 / JCM 8560 / NS-C) TaxID=523849 RepID=H3ZQ02_THELN|nr:hypothetical protein [Thermococcus litoralis]EHR77965.1 hypothetical protein OCC_02902 [Thermococcus litoralis DSM 5473]
MNNEQIESIITLAFLFAFGVLLIIMAYKVPNPFSPFMSNLGLFIVGIILLGVALAILIKVFEESW